MTSLVIYHEQINHCEVTDGLLADHSGTVVIADSGPWLDYLSEDIKEKKTHFKTAITYLDALHLVYF